MALRDSWRERRAASDRAVSEWGPALIAFELVAVAALILLASLLVWGEVRWTVVVGGAAGFAIFLWQARRNAKVERTFEPPRD
jgi:Flp pilus assembly protein TadB